MVKKRPGYRGVSTHVAEVVWAALQRHARENNQSETEALNELLADGLGVPRSKLPARRKPGPKPKK